MMRRIPEPELMDGAQQARAYAEADFSEPNALFVERLRRVFPDHERIGYVLDLGCGPADICLRIAHAYPSCRIHGVDGSQTMLDFARAAIARARLEDRVQVQCAQLPLARLPRPRYDAVVANSLLHHLADPMVLWQLVRHYARSGAPVLIMDLLRPRNEEELERLVREYAAGAPQILRRDFVHSLRAAYRVEEVEEQLARARLSHFAVEVVSNRHFTVMGQSP
jgi:SAM-dependent methyltransferase